MRVLGAPHPGQHLTLSFLNFSPHSSGCVVMSHCAFNLHFPIINTAEHILMSLLSINITSFVR